MKPTTRKIAGAAGSVLMLTAMSAGAATAFAEGVDEGVAPEVNQATYAAGVARVQAATVEGTFSFTQNEITPTSAIAKAMNAAAKHLCGSKALLSEPTGASTTWEIAVKGAVGQEYTASLDELLKVGKAHVAMGCSCAGNPADGRASVNAEVDGVTVSSILETAGVSETANTIVFTSRDGYEIALPLNYVTQRYSLIVCGINGEPVENSVGGTNQLWLGSTSARYFARDVVSITLEDRETPPPAPGTDEAGDAYANVPNVSVLAGGELS